ncbi:MAG: hypothetical protein JST89_16915 [Cyanobacteria bacterium SZAS-4]|nr:hypothetical protein [Cyanobacteria bacterium SZAS-4]
MPRSRKLLANLSKHTVSYSLNSAQASWAELLTGVNLFSNGCAGYAHPTSSLNTLAVFTEADLLAVPKTIEPSSGSTVAVVNVPIILPRSRDRLWLADGSLPTNRLFSPSELSAESIFKSYLPRAYESHAGAARLPQMALVNRCIETESQRLLCVASLFQRKGLSKFVYRLSLFDQLAHLLGIRFLEAADLSSFGNLSNFLRELDDVVESFSAHGNLQMSFISNYSHEPCRATLNLNLVLAAGGFTQLADAQNLARASTQRMNVATAMWKPTVHNLTSLEGCLDTSRTAAASPVAGCIYINKRTVFDDGIVDDDNYLTVRGKVVSYLQNFLISQYGSSFEIEVHPSDFNKTKAPDLIVKIDGVEFQNLSASMAPITPLTTHVAKGFALLPERLNVAEQISATQLASLLND